MNVDPLAELIPTYSPFNYAFNSPIFFVDSDGRIPKVPGKEGDLTVEYSCPERMMDYYKDDKGRVFYNPDVNKHTPLPKDYTYLGETWISPNGVLWGKDGKPVGQSVQKLNEVVVLAGSGKKYSKKKWWDFNLTVWGHGTLDRGPRGSNKGSLHVDDFAVSSSKKLNWKFLNKRLRYIRFGLGFESRKKKIEKRFNESTMESKVEQEAKNIPEKVQLTIEVVKFVVLKRREWGFDRDAEIRTESRQVSAYPKDTASIRVFYRKKLDSTRNANN